MNEQVIKAAEKLAQELSSCKEITNLQKARIAYTQNPALAKIASEYMVQSAALEEEMKKGENADKDVMVAIKDKMNELGAELSKSDDIVNLRNAEASANELLSEVNRILDRAITGESEEECTHDCSHCKGCH